MQGWLAKLANYGSGRFSFNAIPTKIEIFCFGLFLDKMAQNDPKIPDYSMILVCLIIKL